MDTKNAFRNMIIFFFIPLLLAGCVSVASQDDLEQAKRDLAEDVRNVEDAIIDALPIPVPKDPLKDLVGWVSDTIIIGGGGGGAAILAKKKLGNNGGKSKKRT